MLKPSSRAFPDLAANEFVCIRFAGAFGLNVPNVNLGSIGRPVLIVDRFDREIEKDGGITRLHQVDACQALGTMPDRKYQSDGGPGFSDISDLIRSVCTSPLRDLEALVKVALFNLLIGNCDAHGKNFSFLHRSGEINLSPFYDLVSTTVYPGLTTNLSMRFGSQYSIALVGIDDLSRFAKDIGVRLGMVKDSLSSLKEAAPAAWDTVTSVPEFENYHNLVETIHRDWEIRVGRLWRDKGVL